MVKAVKYQLEDVQGYKSLLRHAGEHARKESARHGPDTQREERAGQSANRDGDQPGPVHRSQRHCERHVRRQKPQHEPVAARIDAIHDLPHLDRGEPVVVGRRQQRQGRIAW